MFANFDSEKYKKDKEEEHRCFIEEIGTGLTRVLEYNLANSTGRSLNHTRCDDFATVTLGLSKLSDKEWGNAIKELDETLKPIDKMTEEWSKYFENDFKKYK